MGLLEQTIDALKAAGLRAEESYPGRPMPHLNDVAAAVSVPCFFTVSKRGRTWDPARVPVMSATSTPSIAALRFLPDFAILFLLFALDFSLTFSKFFRILCSLCA